VIEGYSTSKKERKKDSRPWSTAQDARNRPLAVHKLVDSRILILAGGKSTITEITGYKYFSLIKPSE